MCLPSNPSQQDWDDYIRDLGDVFAERLMDAVCEQAHPNGKDGAAGAVTSVAPQHIGNSGET